MANRNVKMSKLKRAFQMLASNTPQRDICTQLHMGRGVLARYKKAADEKNLSYITASCMSEEELNKFLKSIKQDPVATQQRKELTELLPDYVSELYHNRYKTIQKLHEDYKKDNPDGYGYTQFKKAIREYQYANNLSYHNTYVPGREMQIDFAGDSLWLTNPKTGERTSIVVLVCVLPYSGIGFIKAMYNASMENFFSGISDAFTFYGGTTQIAKSDNMRQWVKKHDRYEPVFNEAAVEWAAYYNTSLETCRVKTPRDKGAVEGLVNKVYNAVYSELRDEVVSNLHEMNGRIQELMDIFNSKPSRTTGRSRLDIFIEEEKEFLRELPKTPYRFRYRKEVKLTNNYHIEIDRHKYSVPYQFVGQHIVVVWDIDTVEIYSGPKRIASHKRSMSAGYSTLEEHMPQNHQEYKHSLGFNAAYYQEQADAIGPNTRIAVDNILKRNLYVVQGYKSCQGVLSLRKIYGKERLEDACKMLSEYGSVTYTMIKNILKKNLDKKVDMPVVTRIPENEYVRGSKEFCKFIGVN